MKKMILFAAAIMMAFGASAQMSLVKDLAKKATSGNPQALFEVMEQIDPPLPIPRALTTYSHGTLPVRLHLVSMIRCLVLNRLARLSMTT